MHPLVGLHMPVGYFGVYKFRLWGVEDSICLGYDCASKARLAQAAELKPPYKTLNPSL